MSRIGLGQDVLTTAIERMEALYGAGHRIVVSFSAGKDSGACLEICIEAARRTGRLPVEVLMRDEEIMFPGTYEYAERVAARPEVEFHWIYACQPIINIFNRKNPYWWVFDPDLPPERLVRQPPAIAYQIPDKNIEKMNDPSRFPPPEGKELYSVVGLRVQESSRRRLGLHSSKGYVTKPGRNGVRLARPIYDWEDGDIWLAHRDLAWDYNRAYDVMHKLGVSRSRLRIAPPTMNAAGVGHLQVAAKAWPNWFDAVCERLPGVRTAAMFGKRAVEPIRRDGESWEACFKRTCIEEAPAAWISERSVKVMNTVLSFHRHHSTKPLPQVSICPHCTGGVGSWRYLARAMFNGDPFCAKTSFCMPYVEPEFFRPGAGTWGGKPVF